MSKLLVARLLCGDKPDSNHKGIAAGLGANVETQPRLITCCVRSQFGSVVCRAVSSQLASAYRFEHVQQAESAATAAQHWNIDCV